MGKTIERMRANPKADWQISDVQKACREAGVRCTNPGSGSHYQIGNPGSMLKLTIPARRPIRPVYIVKLVKYLDQEGVQ